MSIIFPLFYELCYNTYGLFGGIAIIGALQLHVCVGGTFFRPIKLQSDGAQVLGWSNLELDKVIAVDLSEYYEQNRKALENKSWVTNRARQKRKVEYS